MAERLQRLSPSQLRENYFLQAKRQYLEADIEENRDMDDETLQGMNAIIDTIIEKTGVYNEIEDEFFKIRHPVVRNMSFSWYEGMKDMGGDEKHIASTYLDEINIVRKYAQSKQIANPEDPDLDVGILSKHKIMVIMEELANTDCVVLNKNISQFETAIHVSSACEIMRKHLLRLEQIGSSPERIQKWVSMNILTPLKNGMPLTFDVAQNMLCFIIAVRGFKWKSEEFDSCTQEFMTRMQFDILDVDAVKTYALHNLESPCDQNNFRGLVEKIEQDFIAQELCFVGDLPPNKPKTWDCFFPVYAVSEQIKRMKTWFLKQMVSAGSFHYAKVTSESDPRINLIKNVPLWLLMLKYDIQYITTYEETDVFGDYFGFDITNAYDYHYVLNRIGLEEAANFVEERFSTKVEGFHRIFGGSTSDIRSFLELLEDGRNMVQDGNYRLDIPMICAKVGGYINVLFNRYESLAEQQYGHIFTISATYHVYYLLGNLIGFHFIDKDIRTELMKISKHVDCNIMDWFAVTARFSPSKALFGHILDAACLAEVGTDGPSLLFARVVSNDGQDATVDNNVLFYEQFKKDSLYEAFVQHGSQRKLWAPAILEMGPHGQALMLFMHSSVTDILNFLKNHRAPLIPGMLACFGKHLWEMENKIHRAALLGSLLDRLPISSGYDMLSHLSCAMGNTTLVALIGAIVSPKTRKRARKGPPARIGTIWAGETVVSKWFKDYTEVYMKCKESGKETSPELDKMVNTVLMHLVANTSTRLSD